GPLTTFYGAQMLTLIRDWRARFGDDLYFAWVQLPRTGKPQRLPSEPTGWGVSVRDGQRRALALPRTSMAITIDLGDPMQGHPTNKADFAHRLAMVVLHDVYQQPMREWTGPLFRSAKTDGAKLVLTFDHAEGLRPRSGPLKGFAIAGEDRKFVWADATIDGSRVTLASDQVPRPVAVRYAWASNPDANLVNAADLPASPFRTDDWD
ncbi:MAG TPA: 9-O-acetylesterase, partial [Pirellulales bacterium]|nr:9-O-acetylesterase [Pirellulales bacterium]